MNDPLRAHLGAYLDGELHGPARQAMLAHLKTCQACREELASLRRLSETLRKAPLPEGLPPAGRFASRLAMRLPPRPARWTAFPAARLGGLIPVGLLAALLMIQAATFLNILLRLAAGAGYLGDVGAWFVAGPRQTLGFSAVLAILGNMLNLDIPANLQFANNALVSLLQWFEPLRWQMAVTISYLAWLAVWWIGRRAAPGEAALHREHAFDQR